MSYQITVEPAEEPITLAEAKAHCRVDWSDDDTIIGVYITAARKFCEHYTNRAFITQTWRQNEDVFSEPIILAKNPVQSITSVKYYDTDDNQQTLSTSNYQVDILSDEAKIYEGVTNGYPSISLDVINPIEIIMVSGYGLAASVPEDIKSAIKIMTDFFYENRDMVNVPVASIPFQIPIPNAVYAILNPYRVRVFGE
jgi:uncharacterized phiE125 gp8 family phage protein